jgi:hypothetical protein
MGSEARPIVVYVTGYGRSGSTLIDIGLGLHPQIASGGELVQSLLVFENDRQPCSCGRALADCEVWSRARAEVRSILRGHRLTLREAFSMQRRVEARWSIVRSFAGMRGHERLPERELTVYRQVQEVLFRAAAGGAPLVVDSSKTAAWAGGRPAALHRVMGLPIRCIHLVRSPRSLVGSLARGSNRELEGARSSRPFQVPRGMAGWIGANLWADVAGAVIGREAELRVSYEALVARPERTFEQIALFLGVSPAPILSALGAAPFSPRGHLLAGNRMRLGPVAIRPPAPPAGSPGQRMLGSMVERLFVGRRWRAR